MGVLAAFDILDGDKPAGFVALHEPNFRHGHSQFSVAGLVGSIPLVPTAIASALSGNVLANQQNVGLALGFDMVIVIGVVMVLYLLLQRRASRWAPR